MGISKEKLQNFKTQLATRRDVLSQEIQAATSEWINDEPMFADSVDQANADTDRGIAVQIRNRDRVILKQIDEALRRIEQGSFGECDRCAGLISEARMLANPSTTLCIDCKAELESEEQRYSNR